MPFESPKELSTTTIIVIANTYPALTAYLALSPSTFHTSYLVLTATYAVFPIIILFYPWGN